MAGPPFATWQTAWDYILAGRAKFTLRSEKTLDHITYKIRRREKDSGPWFVHVRCGSGYAYLGTIFEDTYQFRATSQTASYWMASPKFKVFQWFWSKMTTGRQELPSNLSVFHEDRCGFCGQPLTDPFSIETGFGPTCRKKQYA